MALTGPTQRAPRGSATHASAGRTRLAVDWIRCEGHGLCAELLPEVVGLDDWGFPVVRGSVPDHLAHLAARAKAACPVLALRLERG